MFVSALQTEIFDTGYCWIVHLSFLTSHNLLFFRFCKTSKKTTFSVFLSFFLVKLPKSQSLKLNISRTAQPILMILVSFCRILNGILNEINLFWRCSSPLTWACGAQLVILELEWGCFLFGVDAAQSMIKFWNLNILLYFLWLRLQTEMFFKLERF